MTTNAILTDKINLLAAKTSEAFAAEAVMNAVQVVADRFSQPLATTYLAILTECPNVLRHMGTLIDLAIKAADR